MVYISEGDDLSIACILRKKLPPPNFKYVMQNIVFINNSRIAWHTKN